NFRPDSQTRTRCSFQREQSRFCAYAEWLRNCTREYFFAGGLGSPVHITLGKDANASTFVHELGHFYL
ncbi:MAG: hypothetical protein Q4E17_07265, partial [Synergistes sp.]|nr:hypothetical protein [Synergistes sp.]